MALDFFRRGEYLILRKRMRRSEHRRYIQTKRLIQGLCVVCGSEAYPGLRRCSSCVKPMSKHQRVSFHGRRYKEEQLKEQNYKCAICECLIPTNGHLDHNHKTGAWRGVLCANCNFGIGFLREDPRLFDAARRYLEVWNNERTLRDKITKIS